MTGAGMFDCNNAHLTIIWQPIISRQNTLKVYRETGPTTCGMNLIKADEVGN